MNDPFGFNNNMNSLINNMMMDPFGNQQQQRNNNNANHRNAHNNMMMSPFGGAGMVSPFDRHNQMMQQMNNNNNPFALINQMMGMNHMSGGGGGGGGMQVINSDPNSQIFSSSSVVSYSNTGDGKPKVYQESTQMRQGPGGVKETRKMVRDSEKGIEKIAVGHHIGDRAHVIERQKVRGEVEEIVNLENLDDEQVNEFNQEFESKITSQMRSNHHHHNGGHRSSHHQQHLGANIPFAIEDSSRHGKKDKERKSKSKPKN